MITLEDIKRDLRLTHDQDDALLQILLDAAVDEACQFISRPALPGTVADSEESSSEYSSEIGPVPHSLYAAVFLLVRAKYDAATPDEIKRLRECAETLMMPYRIGLGV
jgi:hypothetical protein